MKSIHRYSFKILLISAAVVLGTTEAANDFVCQAPGKFANHYDPTKFHTCHLVGENKYTMFLQSCPVDTCFDNATKVCSIDSCELMMGEMTPPIIFNCPSAGKFPHLDTKRRDAFYKCVEIQGKFHVYEYQCLSAKPCFNSRRQMCQLC